MVQGTEISAAPVGVGMTFTPGQILDPLNDLIEQFSQVMLVAMVAFGVEKVLLTAGAAPIDFVDIVSCRCSMGDFLSSWNVISHAGSDVC